MRKKYTVLSIAGLTLILLCILSACYNSAPIPAHPASTTPIQVTVPVQEPPPAQVPTLKTITLSDSSEILNLLPLLPGSFVNENVSDSTAQYFWSKDAHQQIICNMNIVVDNSTDREAENTYLKDPENCKQGIIRLIKAKMGTGRQLSAQDVTNINVVTTYPEIGDFAVYGQGTFMIGNNGKGGADILIFEVNKVYVTLTSFYGPPRTVNLTSLASGIITRINYYSQ